MHVGESSPVFENCDMAGRGRSRGRCSRDRGTVVPVGSTDRISSLPEEVRVLILEFLPIRDAVRTSKLARNWRYSWKKAQKLTLDQMRRDEEYYMSGKKYCRIVGRILSSHVGTINKFVLCPVWRNLPDESNDWGEEMKGWRYVQKDMPTWLHILSRKGVKALAIHFTRGDVYDMFYRNDAEYPDLPSSIFQCLELTNLSLKNCELRDSVEFRGFPNLVSLALTEVDISEDTVEKILSSCPLEELHLISCYFMSGTRTISISAPHLKIFKVVYEEGIPCNLEFTPNLRVATFGSNALNMDNDLWDLCLHFIDTLSFIDTLRHIPKIEDLTFECALLKPSGSDIIPKMLPEVLVSLKYLTLRQFAVSSMDHISILLCIVRSSPHLQNLSIKMAFGISEQTSDKTLNASIANVTIVGKVAVKTSITALKVTVKTLENASRIRTEMDFIESILLCCPNLRKLDIKSPSCSNDSVKLELSNAVGRFENSSSKPKVTHVVK